MSMASALLSPTERAELERITEAMNGKFTFEQVVLLRSAFLRFDLDRNGVLDKFEFDQLIRSVDEDLARRFKEELFQDEYATHRLDLIEFCTLLKNRLTKEESMQLLEVETRYLESLGLTDDVIRDILRWQNQKELRCAGDEMLHQVVVDCQGRFTLSQVKALREVFLQADTDSSGTLDRDEFEALMKLVDPALCDAVMADLFKGAYFHHHLDFRSFCQLLAKRLTTTQSLGVMAMEQQYKESMGVDAKEEEELEKWRQQRGFRRASSIHHKPGSRKESLTGSLRRDSEAEMMPRQPNDVDAYKHEFGLDQERPTEVNDVEAYRHQFGLE